MKKALLIIVVAILVYGYVQDQGLLTPGTPSSTGDNSLIQEAFDHGRSDIQVSGSGIVSRTLSDDREGSRHQRFILRLDSGLSLLISHNIDLAPRIDGLQAGDTVEFYGEYEWNAKGGVVHWTHHDPAGRHPGGWLKHKNRTYQ